MHRHVENWKDWYSDTATRARGREITAEIRRQSGLDLPGDVAVGPQASNVVYFVGNTHAIKVYCPLFPADYSSEYEALRFLESVTEFPAPKVIHRGILDSSGCHYLILTQQPGEPVGDLWDGLTTEQRTGLLRELSVHIRQMHMTSKAEGSTDREAAWGRFVRKRIDACASSPRRWHGFPPAFQKQVRSFIMDIGARVGADSGTSLLHADINRHHVLCARKGRDWRITGLLDFGDAGFGDPVYDFVGIYVGFCGLSKEYLSVFAETYGGNLLQAQWFRDRWLLYGLIHPHLKLGERLSRITDLTSFGSIEALQSHLFDRDVRA